VVFLLSGIEGLTWSPKARPRHRNRCFRRRPERHRNILQVGAQFGFAMLWTMLLSYPLMAGIQEISAWIGRVTGIGIAGNIRRHYPALTT
jgi:hypothetical protein